jgi:hypothetical protein
MFQKTKIMFAAALFFLFVGFVGCSTTPMPTEINKPEGQPLTYANRKFIESFPKVIQASKNAVLASSRLKGQTATTVELNWALAGEYTDPNTGLTVAFVPYQQVGTDPTNRMLTIQFSDSMVAVNRSGVLKSAFFDDEALFNRMESFGNGMAIYGMNTNGAPRYTVQISDMGTEDVFITTTLANDVNLAGPCNVPNSLKTALSTAQSDVLLKGGLNTAATIAVGYACYTPAVLTTWPCLAAITAKAAATWELVNASNNLVAAQQAITEWQRANCR